MYSLNSSNELISSIKSLTLVQVKLNYEKGNWLYYHKIMMPIRFKDAGDRLADFKLKSRKKDELY